MQAHGAISRLLPHSLINKTCDFPPSRRRFWGPLYHFSSNFSFNVGDPTVYSR
jgi:hypothetical protein